LESETTAYHACSELECFGSDQQAFTTMAVTFDDLPYVDIEQRSLASAGRATKEILRVLQMHSVPVVGFVNEGKLQTRMHIDQFDDLRTLQVQQFL
jgi:hypothetical protein